MTVGSVGGAGGATGVGQMYHDVGDIAFLVALLEVESLDLEIGGRLNEMKGLNAVRKAYGERIAELQRLVDQCGDDGRVQVPVSAVRSGEYVWDATANNGLGGVVWKTGDRAPLGDGCYGIRDPDGSLARVGEVTPLEVGVEVPGIGSPMDAGGCADVEYVQQMNARAYQTHDLAEAERFAAERGGVVVTDVGREELTNEMAALRDKMDSLSSDAEIGMLGLNRLLSRRNQVLQLASNVMSSQHQTAMGLIANLKV